MSAVGTPGSAYAFIPEEVFKNPRPKPNATTSTSSTAATATAATTAAASAADAKKVVLKVFLKSDQTFKTIAATSLTTTTECLTMVSKKLGLNEALASSLTLVERDNKDLERVLDANEHPGALQLQWQVDKVDKKFYAKFSEEGKDTLRKTALKRLSITKKADEPSLSSNSNEPTPSQRIAADLSELDLLAETFAKPSDDLATLDAITADFAASPSASTATATTKGSVAAASSAARPAPLQNTKISKTGQTRVKMVPIDKDDEFQGLLSDLKASSSSSSTASTKPSTPAKSAAAATTTSTATATRTPTPASTANKSTIAQSKIVSSSTPPAKPSPSAAKPKVAVVDSSSFGDIDDMLNDDSKSSVGNDFVGIDESQFKINDADFMPVTTTKETKKTSDIDMAAFDSVFARLDLAGLNDIEEAASNSGGAGSNASTSNADFDFDSVLEKLAASLDDNQF